MDDIQNVYKIKEVKDGWLVYVETPEHNLVKLATFHHFPWHNKTANEFAKFRAERHAEYYNDYWRKLGGCNHDTD